MDEYSVTATPPRTPPGGIKQIPRTPPVEERGATHIGRRHIAHIVAPDEAGMTNDSEVCNALHDSTSPRSTKLMLSVTLPPDASPPNTETVREIPSPHQLQKHFSSGQNSASGSHSSHSAASPEGYTPTPPRAVPPAHSARPSAAAAAGNDDDDDLELSSDESSSDEDEGAKLSSKGPTETSRSSYASTSSSQLPHSPAQLSRGAVSFGKDSMGSPVTVGRNGGEGFGRRRQSAAHDLLLQATQSQQRLLQEESTSVAPVLPGMVTVASSARLLGDAPDPFAPTPQGSLSARSVSNSSLQQGVSRSVSTNSSVGASSFVKRQSIADIRKSLAIGQPVTTPRDGNTSPPLSGKNSALGQLSEDAKLGNAKVRKFIAEVRDAMNTFRKETGSGANDKRSLGDAAFDEIKRARDVLEMVKQQAAKELALNAKNAALIVDAPDIKRSAVQLFEDLVKEGDKRSNGEVVAAMVTHIASIDFPSMILARQLHLAVCSEGYPKYLELFLSQPRVRETLQVDTAQQLLRLAAGHPVHRVDLLASVFRYTLHCPSTPSIVEALKHVFQESFEQAVSMSKAGPMEDRSRRSMLIDEAVRTKGLINFGTRDGPDKQTIFSRAAREGDVELLVAIINNNLVADVNRVQPDGTNALQQAAARGHFKAVEILCRLSQIAPSLSYVYPGRGTALELAMSSKHKNTEMISLLRSRAIELRVLVEKTSITPEEGEAGSSASPVMDRRQSKAAFARKKSIALGAEREEELVSVNGVLDATSVVKVLLTSIKPLYEQIKYEESFDPKGDELRKLGQLKSELQRSKDAMTMRLQKLEPTSQLELRKEEVRNDVIDLMDKLILETSKLGGNLGLFELCIQRFAVNFDFLNIAAEKNWFQTAPQNGSVEFVNILLKLPGVKEHNLQSFQTKLMFDGAAASSMYRIDSLLNLFSHEDTLNMDYFHPLLRPTWQQAFEDICSVAKARPQEIRGNRMQLIKLMVEHPLVRVDANAVGSDKHTVLSRACSEGDAMLVYFLLNPSGPDGSSVAKDPNQPTADGMTPLMHACARGHKQVVEVFSQLASVRPEKESLLKHKIVAIGGNAADVAAKSKQMDVVALLKSKGVIPIVEQVAAS